jgi:hypothetical protein
MNIDHEVAEKVMGWKHHEGGFWYKPNESRDNQHELLIERTDETTSFGNAWPPSTNIAQAFEVVEKLVDGGLMQFLLWTELPDGWTASFNYTGVLSPMYQGRSQRKEKAICLAALKATSES